jgi:hypothetical protein
MATESAARRFYLASPEAWVAVLGGLAALSFAAMILLSRQVGNGAVALLIGVPYAGVGVLVARRQPRNPLGSLLLVSAVCLFLGTGGGDYSVLR